MLDTARTPNVKAIVSTAVALSSLDRTVVLHTSDRLFYDVHEGYDAAAAGIPITSVGTAELRKCQMMHRCIDEGMKTLASFD